MRSLRKTLTALSPAIILVSVFCGIISGQSGLTTIQDTLFDADGARYNGTLTIDWSTFSITSGTIVQQSKTVQVVNGNLLVQLTPNNTAPPPANIYTVFYQSDGDQQYTETWTVPVSATPLKLSQVKIGSGAGSGGGGSAGGLTGSTGPVTESAVTNLISDLNARPVKGPAYGTNAVAVIDQNGQIETAVGNLGDCVFVDGTTGPCAPSLPTFVDTETPGGAVNGLNATFTLANSPSGASLLLFRNGVLLQAGLDYTLTGSTIQFVGAAVPQPQDTLVANYRIDNGAGNNDSSTGPSGAPGVNGCGAVGAVSKSFLYQIVPGDNGYLLIQTVNAGFALPVTVPPAGWCVALLNTTSSSIPVGSSGNSLNGSSGGYSLQSSNAVSVISNGSGYWLSGANGAMGPVGAAGPAGSTAVCGSTGQLIYNNNSTCAAAGSGTKNQILQSGGSGSPPSWHDSRDVKIIPFAAAPGGAAAAGVSYATGQWTATARSGFNNLGAAIQAAPNAGASLQFMLELPTDWDPSSQPYINVFYGSGANNGGTAVWTASSACSKQDGSVSDDPSFSTEASFGPQTMAAPNRMWGQGGQFTAIVSGNNCVAGSLLIVRLALSGTAAANINAYQAVFTIPTLPVAAEVN